MLNDAIISFDSGLARDFLAFAAISPLPTASKLALHAYVDLLAARGAGAMGAWLEIREQLRIDLAALLGVAPDRIALTHGTTHGVQVIAHSLRWDEGRGVLCFNGEFPANVHTWKNVAEAQGAQFRLAPLDSIGDGAEGLDALLEESPTRVVAVSAVQFQSGRRMPIAAMAAACHRHGAMLFVDAVQAAGVAPLDLARAGVDFATGGGHKWLLGGDGAGWLYVAKGCEAQLRPALTGWMSAEDPFRFLSHPNSLDYNATIQPIPRCFEANSTSAFSVVSLGASLKEILKVGVEAIYQATQRYHDAIEPVLVEGGFVSERSKNLDARSGILSLTPPAGVALHDLQPALAAQGIVITIPDGRLRIAPHVHNDWRDGGDVGAKIIAGVKDLSPGSQSVTSR